MRDDVSGVRLHPGLRQERTHRHAFPNVVEPGPAGDAMKVGIDFDAGEGLKLVPGEAERVVDQPEQFEAPGRLVDGGDVAVVEDGPFAGPRLTGRNSLGTPSIGADD